MNYYPFHIGDYASATRHLSWDEDAAYRRLLDIYYTTEKPLPLEMRAIFRLALASTDAHRDAIQTVLNEFFDLTDDGWVNSRADAEIAAMRDKQQKQRDKANKRWHKPEAERGIASALPQHINCDAVASKNDADAMPPTPTPTPTPKEEKKEKVNQKEKPAVGRRPTRKCPDNFEVTDEMRAWAAESAPLADIDLATEKFRDYTFKNAMSDWPATWRNWIRKDHEYALGRQAAPRTTAKPYLQEHKYAAAGRALFDGVFDD